jgi:hypothetical protein
MLYPADGDTDTHYTGTVYNMRVANNKGAYTYIYIYAHRIFEGGKKIYSRVSPTLFGALLKTSGAKATGMMGRVWLLVSIKISMMLGRVDGQRRQSLSSLVIQGNKGLQPHVR